MQWNWQLTDWPNFTYDLTKIEELELEHLKQSSVCIGAIIHFTEDEHKKLMVDILSSEAYSTSEIEGEILNRSSVQSSIRRNLGLESDNRKISPAERDIAKLMISLYTSYKKALTHQELFKWHELISSDRKDLNAIGHYRTHKDSMQIVSGPIHDPKIHFEAPPSHIVKKEMSRFIKWFNNFKSPKLPYTLLKASIAHLYFESIHPFEDGNGRVGRAIVIKSLAQSLNKPILISLSDVIQKNKKEYYAALAASSKTLDITEWIIYFAKTILKAQQHSINFIKFLIAKAHLFKRLDKMLNNRQTKVLLRIFQEGLEGFKGGLSAENYIKISNTSRSTATRDLQELIKMGALKKEGSLKSTRYYLNIENERPRS